MKTRAIVIIISVGLLSGCMSLRITDPKTGIILDKRTFLTKEGAKDITFSDGNRSVTIETGEKDQTSVANKLIELGQSLK